MTDKDIELMNNINKKIALTPIPDSESIKILRYLIDEEIKKLNNHDYLSLAMNCYMYGMIQGKCQERSKKRRDTANA